MNPFGDAHLWAQFGLAGLVLFAMFVGVFLILRWVFRQSEKADIAHHQLVEQLMKRHADERAEWRQDTEESYQQHTEALRTLTKSTIDALHELREELTTLRLAHTKKE